MTDWYHIATMSAKSAGKRGCFAVCGADMDDMIQEAAIAIWQHNGKDRSEAYLFTAGRRQAESWLIWWKYGAPHTKLRGLFGKIETPISLSWHAKRVPVECRGDATDKTMTDSEREKLYKVFYETRRKHGKSELRGIERDIEIVDGLVNGDSTAVIGERLGLSVKMVNSYRQLLRKRLTKYIDETKKGSPV